jgi:hypothetical protein
MDAVPFAFSVAIALCLTGFPLMAFCLVIWCMLLVCVRCLIVSSGEEHE